MKNLYTLDEWETEFNPYQDDEGCEIFYEPNDDYEEDCLKNQLDALAREHGTFLYQHLWTRVDGDSGKLILLNDRHLCNRLDYCVTGEPWGNKNNHESNKDIYIEVKYEV